MEADIEKTPRLRRVYLEAFGCQMNVLDGELVLSDLRRRGWEISSQADDADLVIFNTCSVREHAEERVHSRVGQLKTRKERDPGFRIAGSPSLASTLFGLT